MKNLLLILVFAYFSFDLIGQELPLIVSEKDFSIGKSFNVKSHLLDEIRELNVYLPPSYSSDSSKSYPVIYLLDGSKDEDFIHIAGIVQFGSFPWIGMIPESIVIGIGNVDRKRDFTFPTENKIDKMEFPTSGQSAKFIQFLKQELQPFIDAKFRTDSTKTIIGQSLGGLLATEILFENPDAFDNYIIVSPSLWWDDEELLTRQPKGYTSDKSIYIAVGNEGEIMERIAKELFNKLNKQKEKNTRLFYEFLEDKNHGDALHSATYNAFDKIFKLKND